MGRYSDPPETYLDRDGWTQKRLVSDEKCILICLRNGLKLDGMDKKQVARLVAQYVELADKAPKPPLSTTAIEYDGRN